MKKFRKLIPAFVLLLFAAAIMSSATYAWFSMNTKVTVTGMQVKTKVSSNLLIAEDAIDSTAKLADSNFNAGPLTETVKGILEPVSTINGKNFWYTLDAKANGAKEDAAVWTAYNAATAATDSSTYGNKFSEDYGVSKTEVNTFTGTEGPAVAYVDYVFQLKAVATSDSYLNLITLNLFNANSKDDSKAHRVAIFMEDITSGTATADAGTLQAIFTQSGAANQTSGEAVTSASATAAVSYNAYADTTNNTLTKITAGSTKYYKVVVRLWVEGEDTTCYNDKFLALSNAWSLDIELALQDANTAAVSNIKMYNSAVVSTTTWYYDGTYVWNDKANVGTETGRTAKASADAAVKTAFGIPTE